jgi:hypothetical protein
MSTIKPREAPARPMRRSTSESGQVLVGTLVIMVLVFGMAGSVALAASSLLDRQASRRSAIDSDLRASDALTYAVANIAGRGLDVTDQQFLKDCLPAKSFSNSLPGGFQSTASCSRFDGVIIPVGGSAPDVSAIPLLWAGRCASAPLSTNVGSYWVFFNALSSSGLVAWVDNQANCGQAVPGGAECPKSVAPGQSIAQVAMDCNLAELRTPFLHIVNRLSSPAVARFVANNSSSPPVDHDGGDTTGSIYELAATTGLGAGQQFEEGAVFVSRDGKATALVSEGSL